MNVFLWAGLVCTVLLLASILLDGLDDAFDAVDLGPPWLSLSVVLAFFGAFGFGTGAFVGSIGPLAAVPGVAAGAGFGWLAARLTAAAMHMPTGAVDTEEAMLGSLGRVVTPTTAVRTGEVLLHRPTGPLKVACTADGELAVGTEVVVVDVRSATLVHVQAFELHLPHDPSTTPEENPEPWNPS